MRAVECHGYQVSLHSFGQGANLTIKSQGPRAAERGCEEGISGSDRVRSPTVREGKHSVTDRFGEAPKGSCPP